MVLNEALPHRRVRIAASDISNKALSFAQRAVYPAERCHGVSAAWLSRYFAAEGRPAGELPDCAGAAGPGGIPPHQPGGILLLAASVSGHLLPQRDDLFRPADAGAGDRRTEPAPRTGRLSLCRARGEPDSRLAFARIREAGGLPEAGKERGQCGTNNCGHGGLQGRPRCRPGAGDLCAGMLHRALGLRSQGGRGRVAALHAARFGHRSGAEQAEPLHVRRHRHSQTAGTGLRAGRVEAPPGGACGGRSLDDGPARRSSTSASGTIWPCARSCGRPAFCWPARRWVAAVRAPCGWRSAAAGSGYRKAAARRNWSRPSRRKEETHGLPGPDHRRFAGHAVVRTPRHRTFRLRTLGVLRSGRRRRGAGRF